MIKCMQSDINFILLGYSFSSFLLTVAIPEQDQWQEANSMTT